jgi:hypothetical protein
MIQGEVHVDAADVQCWARRQDELRNPPADDHDVVTVFAQQVYEFQQNRPRRLNLIGGVIAKGQRHVGLITSSRIADAASSPRPLVCMRSR